MVKYFCGLGGGWGFLKALLICHLPQKGLAELLYKEQG